MEHTFTHTRILHIFPHVKARSMISWSERGLIKPLRDAVGRGSSRLYSYTNLIEISIISELLRYSLPFSTIKLVMRNEDMKRIFRDGRWNTIFYISNGVTGGESKRTPAVSFESANDFLKKGGEMIMGAGKFSLEAESSGRVIERTPPIPFNASAIVININALKSYVDHMIK